MKRNAAVVVVGSSNTDMIVRVDRLPRPGETVLGGEFLTAAGGKGANQAVAAARAGARVIFIARVGMDELGARVVANLRADGIDVRHVTRDRAARSGVALIMVSKQGENSIAVASGANARLSPTQVREAAGVFKRAGILLVQLETSLATVAAAVDLARGAGVPVILNPAPALAVPDALLRKVDIITPNETEAELLTGVRVKGEASAARAAEALLRRGVPVVALTMGRRGVLVASHAARERIAAFAVDAIDTTAAGDVFSGTLAAALAAGQALGPAVRRACAAAALSVTRVGAQPSVPTRAEVERFLKAADAQGATAAAPGRRGSAAPKK
jgi:ribokinase